MIHFQLVSTQGTKFDADVYEVLVPTQDGTIAVFEDHMPVLGAGMAGVISVRKKSNDSDSDMDHFAVNGGIVQVDGKALRFLSDDVSSSDEVSEQEAEAAHARAQELVASAEGQVAIHEAKRALMHAGARLQVARLKRRHHS